MSYPSQENNMRKLAKLLSTDLSYLWGERESGPNGDKKTFLHTGKVFLHALALDLGLKDAKVTSNAGGIAVSGACYLTGMWQENGIHICLEQPCGVGENVLLYRSIRSAGDHKGGYNRYIRLVELASLSYPRLLARLEEVRRENAYEHAA